MTEIDRTREWRLHPDGHLLGYRQHVDPHGGGISWATVDLVTNEVIALEQYCPELGRHIGGASCHPHQLVTPPGLLDGYAETGLAAIINPRPSGCNICGEPLHKGCCNPKRPAAVIREVTGVNDVLRQAGLDVPPLALTDAHVRELERAIRAEGYIILIDHDCNITLERGDVRNVGTPGGR